MTADRIETALRALLDSPNAVGLAERIEAHASAQHATSYGTSDASAVHEQDALLATVADALAHHLNATSTGPRRVA